MTPTDKSVGAIRCVRAHLAHCVKNCLAIEEAAAFRSYSHGKGQVLPVGCGVKDKSIPCVGVECPDDDMVEWIGLRSLGNRRKRNR
jgi:hypothetical protein